MYSEGVKTGFKPTFAGMWVIFSSAMAALGLTIFFAMGKLPGESFFQMLSDCVVGGFFFAVSLTIFRRVADHCRLP